MSNRRKPPAATKEARDLAIAFSGVLASLSGLVVAGRWREGPRYDRSSSILGFLSTADSRLFQALDRRWRSEARRRLESPRELVDPLLDAAASLVELPAHLLRFTSTGRVRIGLLYWVGGVIWLFFWVLR